MKRLFGLSLIILTMVLVACNQSNSNSEGAEDASNSAETVRIGYFPNLTHITTIVALENGYFQDAFSDDISIDTQTFPNGSAFMEALTTGAFDLGTVGPTPTLITYTRSQEHEIIAGAVSGGAVLAVRNNSGIESIEDLQGTRIAIPTIGSTQDIMLRKAMENSGYSIGESGSDITVVPQAPADTATLFLQEDVDGAATQEPWGVYLENNADASILLDENDFAWGRDMTMTVVTAAKSFTQDNPELTEAYLRAHHRAALFIQENPEEAVNIFINHVETLTGTELNTEEILLSLDRLEPTSELNEEALQEMADIAEEANYITTNEIDGLVNLEYLNRALEE